MGAPTSHGQLAARCPHEERDERDVLLWRCGREVGHEKTPGRAKHTQERAVLAWPGATKDGDEGYVVACAEHARSVADDAGLVLSGASDFPTHGGGEFDESCSACEIVEEVQAIEAERVRAFVEACKGLAEVSWESGAVRAAFEALSNEEKWDVRHVAAKVARQSKEWSNSARDTTAKGKSKKKHGPRTCRACDGSGRLPAEDAEYSGGGWSATVTCNYCKGRGEVTS